MTALKTILFMLFVPGLLLVGLPLYLFQTDPALFSFGISCWLAVPLWAVGAAGDQTFTGSNHKPNIM